MEATLRRIAAGVANEYDWIYLGIVLLGAALVIAVVAKIIASIAGLATTKVCEACKTRVPNGATKCRACGSAV